MSIAERLEIMRASTGLKQEEMAERLDISLRMYTEYAKGRLPPPTKALIKLAEEGFDITWLLTGKTPRIPGAPKGAWTEKPPAFSVPGKDSWLLDETFMAGLIDGIARCYPDSSKLPPPAELGCIAARICADIASVSHSAEQRKAALEMALMQLRRNNSA